MKHITIGKILYNYHGKGRHIGIADYKCQGNEMLEIEITSTTVASSLGGMREFPYFFYIPSLKARMYETMIVKGTKLHIIPLSQMEVRNEEKVENKTPAFKAN